MKIRIRDIEPKAKHLAYDEPTEDINAELQRGPTQDFGFPGAVHVALTYYRAGSELFFAGELIAPVIGYCGRCLEEFRSSISRHFALVFVPRHNEAAARKWEGEEEVEWAYYQGDYVDLSPLVREQILLSLPTRPLCDEDCKGLCPNCGSNLNLGPCACAAARPPRAAVHLAKGPA